MNELLTKEEREIVIEYIALRDLGNLIPPSIYKRIKLISDRIGSSLAKADETAKKTR